MSGQALAKAKGLVENFLWARESDKEAKAQVRWHTIIQQMSKWGIKVLDPQLQANALLTKILIRGLSPSWAPWKTFIRHKISNTHQFNGRLWGVNGHWFITSCRLRMDGSHLWQGILKALTSLNLGRKQLPPTIWESIARQLLYDSCFLTN
jgi:hypothetical protein